LSIRVNKRVIKPMNCGGHCPTQSRGFRGGNLRGGHVNKGCVMYVRSTDGDCLVVVVRWVWGPSSARACPQPWRPCHSLV